ncbi:hemagglutinin [Photorhabdus khanii subsp. guanajuatensis]|uniref:Hemagglutinin n=1 Tax=Photorhabdus khanii subsp. guanajuatensis TaxID=2100166 RepID=A0A4R4JZ83_9GAMM|nr:filamentous hemagglutinin N-terminal domain-containing protein [Photorhabdus khanii]TDB59472.1 hemagglutinin [Photorhabdus khanii subsp. guanajuatensis]
MDKRSTPLVRATSYLLIYLTAVYPLHPAIAAGITPDNHHTQVQHQGHVPVVNIATPNDAGISHNTYQEFNVATQGAVLNNATQVAQSQLAGQLNANPNLKDNAAELIINEVTGNGRSELQGQLEIVGNKANVMIANPNGITCDGCGFINTAGATLTTGKPQFDQQGALEALEVKQGQITLGGKGLDGKATDYVDIISRATALNGKIQANNLSLTQGANRINLKDGTVNPITGEGTKPQLAIDTKALGGMYANKIRLVATEAGVGVNLTHLTTTQDDIRLTAEGKIILGEVQAGTDININSNAIETTAQSRVQAGQHLTLTTKALHNQGQIRAGGDITLKATQLDNVNPAGQSHPIITAGKNSRITADEINNVGELSAAQNLTLTGNNFSTKTIKDRRGNSIGKLSAGGDLTATLKQVFRFDLDKDHVKAGKKPPALALITGKNIALTANDLVNSASMKAAQNVTIDAETVYLDRGNLTAGNQVMLEGKSHIDVKGYDIAGHDVTLLARRGLLSVGSGDDYTSEGIRALTTISADNRLRIIAEGHINIVTTLINRAKNIFLATNDKIEIYSSGDLADFNDEGIQLNDETQQVLITQRLYPLSHLAADENIEVHAGEVIDLRTLSLTAGKDILLTSGGALDISTEDAYEYENEEGNGYKKHYVDEDAGDDAPSDSPFPFPIMKSVITAGNHLTLNAGGNIIDTEATLSAKGTTTLTQNNAELHSAAGKYNAVAGKYTPVTTALIERALSGASQLTLNLAEVEGEVPGLKLADKQTRITSKNNRPIIHIAAPNPRGVSHNRYQAFNVGTSGLVLNNATQDTRSLLAGHISANLNFTGQSAELIIHEVVGAVASNLQGLLEVVGKKAPVVIVNLNGITCNGCGFTNTPAVTFSTGKPVFDKEGALAALTVKKGTITLGEAGWDATAQDKVEIISRATQLHGKLRAKNLTLTQGPNRIDVKRGTLVPLTGEGYTPWEAIETRPLGGIEANALRVVSTEPGKAVNLTTTPGDIRLIADGNISLANTLITRAKNIFLASNGKIDVSLSPLRPFSQWQADENIEIHAGAGINLAGIALTAGKDIALTSGDAMKMGPVTAGNILTLIARHTMTETPLSAAGATTVAKNSTALHSAKGKYTPVTTALIDLASGHTARLTLPVPEIAGGIPGLILADKQTRITLKNNLPVIHIAAPNARGISHNRYQAFNVGALGVVLNNATAEASTVLAGPIKANPNFNGQSAGLIIHEVVGTVASNLQGLLEVAGQTAAVFMANPNGMTCNGCGFIQTPAITLSTGQPEFDKNGALAALTVKKGIVTMDKKGLEATAQDVDILSRAALFNGKIQAKNLTLTHGPNRIDVKRGTLIPITGEGDTPWEAINIQPSGGISADKIQLVSTEPGKEVNLTHLTATQGTLHVTADGEVTLGKVQAKTDITVSSQAIRIEEQSEVQAGKDITLATNTLDNRGQIVAGGDMRLFVDRLHNGLHARLEARHHLWLQKDASGHLSTRIDNDSATLKTQQGDIVIRTTALSHSGGANLTAGANAYINATKLDNRGQFKAQNNLILTGNHFNGTAGTLSAALNVVADFIHQFRGSALISAKNILLHAGDITGMGHLEAENDLSVIGEGQIEVNGSKLAAQKDLTLIAGNDITAYNAGLTGENVALLAREGDIRISGDGASISAHHQMQMVAGNKLDLQGTLATKKNLTLMAGHDIAINQAGLTGENVELLARDGDIQMGSDGARISAGNNVHLFASQELDLQGILLDKSTHLTLNAGHKINARRAKLAAKKNLTLIAGHDIAADHAELTGENVELLVHEGDIRMGRDQSYSWSGLSARDHLRISAGRDLDLYGTPFDKSRHLTFSAGRHLNASQSQLNAAGNLHLFAGHDLLLRRARLNAGQQVTLSAGHDIDMSRHPTSESLLRVADLAGSITQITAGDQLQLSAGGDIVGRIARLTSTQGSVLVNAGRDFIFSAQKYSPVNDEDQHYLYATGTINAAHNLTLTATGNLLTYGTNLTSGSDMRLSAGGNVRFESLPEFIREGNSGRFTQHASQLKSGGALTLRAQGSILFQATELIARGVMDITATGGFLYAQAMEEVYRWEEEKKSCHRVLGVKSCKIFGSKTETRRKERSTNKVTEFTAGGDINLRAKDDVTLEASRIDTQKNAKITSQTGKVNFRAMPNTAFEQTVTTSTGFFITHHDKGHSEKTWIIPSVQVGGTLTVEAADGISADIKVKDGQLLENVLAGLGNTPGTEWLKNLQDRNDVRWNEVKDAYRHWDKKSTRLNPVAGAVIAIAVAAVTAGSGLAAWAGSGAVGATGVTGATASAVYGAAYGGMIGLTSQAAVALIENKGNLTQTLSTLAQRDSVNSLVTQIAVGGALGGLDHAMGWGKLVEGKAVVDPIKAQLPLLSNNNWSQVAQRIAAHSVVSSTLGTAMNGGSFTDNLQAALLSNIGNQMNAEGAKLIGDNGEILGVPGKALSHAAVAALAAEMGGGDAKGAAVGALAAELAAITLDKTFSDPMNIQAGGKIIGGVAGAIATHSVEGANSGANAGEIVIVYNSLAHLLAAAEKEKSGTIKTYEEKKSAFCQQSPEACKQAGEIISVGTDFVPVIGDIKGFVEAESALDYLVAAIAIIPGAGDVAGKTIKAAEKALKKGDVGEASKLINKASDEIKVKWVDENASMSQRARNYNDSALGARSNIETKKGQAPSIDRMHADGKSKPVRFDGMDSNIMIDRKISVVTTPKAKDQALRQSEALKHNGMIGRWEVPNQTQANRAQKMFDELGIKNIEVKVVKE